MSPRKKFLFLSLSLSYKKIILLILVFQILGGIFLINSHPVKAVGENWYDTDWTYRKKLTIDHYSVDADLTDFPVMIPITDDSLKDTVHGGHVAQSTGNDILFTKSDGSTKLSHEIEKYDPITGELVAWVKIDSLSSSTDTVIYMYYGNANCSNQEDATNVWDSNYQIVLHAKSLEGDTLEDSTVNNRDGTNYGHPNRFIGFCGSVDTHSHQGYTTNGDYDYTIHTDALYKYISFSMKPPFGGSLQASNTDPFAGLSNVDHLGDGDYENGKLYVPMEHYNGCGDVSNQKIAVFSASDLSRLSVHDISAQNFEVAGITVIPEDGANGIIYLVSYCDGSKIWKYDLSNFSYLGYISLSSNIPHPQGITHYNNYFYINSDTDSADYTYLVKKDGTVLGTIYQSPSPADYWEGLDYFQGDDTYAPFLNVLKGTGTSSGYICTLNPIVTTNSDGSLSFDGNDDYSSFSYTLPDQGTIELWYKPADSWFDYNTIFDNSVGENNWEMWIDSNGLLKARIDPTGSTPVSYDLDNLDGPGATYHIVFTWEKTGNKVLYVNGVQRDSQSVVWHDPGSNFYLGGGNSGNTKGKGEIDEIRISNSIRSSSWISTSYNNISSPGVFFNPDQPEEYFDHFEISGSSSMTAGASQTITITAKTNQNNIYPYSGDMTLTFSGANSAPDGTQPTCTDKNSNDINFGNSTVLTFSNGIATCTMKLYKAESANIAVTDGTHNSDGHNLGVTVAAGSLNNFLVDAPDSATVGSTFSTTITSRDEYNNTTTNLSGSTSLTVDQGTISPTSLSESEFTDDGIWTGNLTISNLSAEQTNVILTATNGSASGNDTLSLINTPNNPSSLTANYSSDSQIDLSWTDNSSVEDGYKIERKDNDGTWSQIATASANATSYSDTSTSANHKYQYRVRAYNSAGNSDYATSSEVYTTPAAPTIGSPTVDSSTAITWHWTDNSSYEQYFHLDFVVGSGTDVDNIPANSTSYQSTGLSPNTAYAVHVHAYRSDRGESPASSNSSSVYTLANVPSSLSLTADSQTQITASWSANSNPSYTEYYIENITKGTNSGWITDTSWVSDNLECGTSYSFRVKARNGDGVETSFTSTVSTSTKDCSTGSAPPNFFKPPTPPTGGFKLIISRGNSPVSNHWVKLKLEGGPDTTQMAISTFPDFRNASRIKYQKEYNFDICSERSSCPSGIYTVYVRFYNQYGRPSKVISQKIVYQGTEKQENKTHKISKEKSEKEKKEKEEKKDQEKATFLFKKTLYFGQKNQEVVKLQDRLKELGFFPKDIDSTGWFGPITEKAVKEFQKSKGIYPCGIVGPRTRKALNGEKIVEHQYFFKNDLKFNDQGEEVKYLQIKLKNLGYFPSWVICSGWFGPITRNAVKLFQKIHHLPVNGIVDQSTREILNK